MVYERARQCWREEADLQVVERSTEERRRQIQGARYLTPLSEPNCAARTATEFIPTSRSGGRRICRQKQTHPLSCSMASRTDRAGQERISR